MRIFASGGLDELDIDELVRARRPDRRVRRRHALGVSADAPSLDTVYKLVELGGRPVLKLSPGKVSGPGAKQVHRFAEHDVVTLRDETPPAGGEPLLEPVMVGGARTATAPAPPDAVAAAKARFGLDREGIAPEAIRINDPVPRTPSTSERLEALTREARERALSGERGTR